jgi:hypothetical protein
VVRTETLADFGFDVHRRFSPERWASFKRDNAYFMRLAPDYAAKMRLDHGYNPTPAWTAVAQLVAGRLAASEETTVFLGLLDLALLAVAFVVVFRTYGAEVGQLALVVFGSGYAWRWFWTGGAFLRQDWLVATVVAVCMLRRRRFFLAGLLLAYAAMVRVFPAAFLVGPFVLFVRDAVAHRDLRWFARLAAGVAVGATLLFGAGCATGRGPHAWVEFGAKLGLHRKTWLTNNVGLPNVVLYGGETYRRQLVDWSNPEPWTAWQARMDLLTRERRPWILGLGAVLVLLAARAAWRDGEADLAAAVGVAIVFALVVLTNYYWGMLLLLLVRRPWASAAALLALDLVLCAAHFASPAFEVIYGAMSWALLALFAWWLWLVARADRPATAAPAAARSRGGRRAAASRP